MAYKLPSGDFITVQISYVDKNGNPAVVDGAVSWASSNDGISTATVDTTDSTICRIDTPGPVGTAQISATGDADLGEGVRNIVTTFDVEVIAGEAFAGTINVVGTPQPIA